MSSPRTSQLFRRGEVLTYIKGMELPLLTPDEWKKAVDDRQREVSESISSQARWRQVTGVLEAALRAGAIETGVLTGNDGRIVRVKAPKDFWQVSKQEVGRRFNGGKARIQVSWDSASTGHIFVSKDSLSAFLSTVGPRSTTSTHAGVRVVAPTHVPEVGTKRLGRKPKYSWPKFDAECDRLLDYYGPPDPDDPEWPTQAAMESKMAEWSETNMRVNGAVPTMSQIRTHVVQAIDRYRKEQAEKANKAKN